MKALICCLNSKYVHASLAPWCLYSGVREYSCAPVSPKVIEGTINGSSLEFLEKIKKENPQLLSFSCYIWNIEKTLEIAELAKEKMDCKIVLGGPEVSFRPKEVLEEYPFIDYVLSGEGEKAFPFLLDALYFKKDLKEVKSLTYRENSEVITNEEMEYLDEVVSPYCEEYFENLKGRISYIETSRGCPYRCAFCLSGRCGPVRYFPMDRVKEDIIALANSGTKTIKFVDRTFNAKEDRANEIIEFIIENSGKKFPENICFHFEIAGDILKESTLNILEKAPKGLFQLEIGMQSFNEETLKAINRKTNTEKLIENIKKLLSFKNMHIHIDLIAGLKGEDIKSFERSFDIGFNLRANMLQMGFLKLLYGAEMRENKEEFPCEFSEDPPYEVISTPWITREEIISLKKCEDALERLYNSGRFLETINYLLENKYTPFKLFMEIGSAIEGANLSLWEYARKVFLFLKDKKGVNPSVLRDKMISDLLLCSASPKIFDELKVPDKMHNKIKKHLISKLGNNIKIAILYSEEKVLAVDYKGEKDFSSRYSPIYYDLDKIKETLE